MREMKDSGVEWIGEIPVDWKVIRMKNAISKRDGGAWGIEPLGNENDYICIRIADFDYERMTVKQVNDYEFTKRNYDNSVVDRLILKKDDILIEKSGGGEKTPVGRTVIFNESFPCLYANFMDRLRVTESIIPKYMQYILVTFYKNEYVKKYIKQTTGIQNLDITTMLAQEEIICPSLENQHRIATYLDDKCAKIDAIIAQEQAVIEKLKAYKLSVITEAVTKGLNPDVPMKNSGIEWIGEIPAEWGCIRAKYVIKIENGSDPITDGDIPVYGSGSGSFKTCGEYKVGPTVLIGRKGATLNIPHYITERYWNIDTAFNVTVKTSNFSLMYYFYNAVCFDYNFYMSATTLPSMTQTNYRNMVLPYPGIQEQQKISDYLDGKCKKIDYAISRKQAVIDKLAEYKKSLIYEVVTGKKEV